MNLGSDHRDRSRRPLDIVHRAQQLLVTTGAGHRGLTHEPSRRLPVEPALAASGQAEQDHGEGEGAEENEGHDRDDHYARLGTHGWRRPTLLAEIGASRRRRGCAGRVTPARSIAAMTRIGVPGLCPATFDPVLASIPLARNFVLEGLGKATVDREVALLLTSELVTNAIRHAGTRFEVDVAPAGDDRVCISVTDASPVVPRPLDAPPEAQSGRGLFFVEQYAADWGVEMTSAGKRVWFVLPCRE